MGTQKAAVKSAGSLTIYSVKETLFCNDKQVNRNSLPWGLILKMIVIAIGILGWAVLKFKR